MSCAACSSRVEKAVQGVEGVTSCNVNLLTHSMIVEGSASDAAIIKAVEDAGYGAGKKGEGIEGNTDGKRDFGYRKGQRQDRVDVSEDKRQIFEYKQQTEITDNADGQGKFCRCRT